MSKKSLATLTFFTALTIAIAPGPIFGAEEDAKPGETPLFTGRVGLGMIAFPRYTGGTRYTLWPVPLLAVEFGERAYIDYWQAGLYLGATANKRFALGLVATPRIGFEAKDGARLSGMMTRRSSIEAGLGADYAIGEGGIRLAYLRDVTGAGRGGTIQLGVAQRFEWSSGFGVDAFMSASQLDARTANYNFGVRDGEATPSRPSYRPGRAASAYGGLRFNYDLGHRRTILFGYESTLLGNALAASPIVETRVANLFYIGYGWRL